MTLSDSAFAAGQKMVLQVRLRPPVTQEVVDAYVIVRLPDGVVERITKVNGVLYGNFVYEAH